MVWFQQQGTVVTVQASAAVAVQQAKLEQTLADLRIFGDVVSATLWGDSYRFNVQLAPSTKLKRAILLADDIGECVGAISTSDAPIDDEHRIEITVLAQPYLRINSGSAQLL